MKKNSFLFSIITTLIVFILSNTMFAKGWDNKSIEISGIVLYEDNYKAVSEGFVRVIVYDKKTDEVNLIRVVPINPDGNFTTGKINLNSNDEIRIGAYANDVNWDNFDQRNYKSNVRECINNEIEIIIDGVEINNPIEEFSRNTNCLIQEKAVLTGGFRAEYGITICGFPKITNNQQSDVIEIGAYANDVNWDKWDNIIISNNNQQSDANEIGAYANDIKWDKWDNIVINNNQQNDGVEIGAYANDITDKLFTMKRTDEDKDNMLDVDLESDLDNITIYVKRKDNEQDHGGTEFIGTYPRKPRLLQNYPNPFNPTTNIDYSISKNILVNIKVYDITGREVAELLNEFKTPGNYSVIFDGSNLASGFYFYQIIAGDFRETKKMSLLK